MDGQMTIFDFPEYLPEDKEDDNFEVMNTKRAAALIGNQSGICKHSKHKCNKEELWKVADDLWKGKALEMPCPKICCRACKVSGCGARCNGSEEPKVFELRTPCNRMCDVEWCSIKCFERRGWMYDRIRREWIKDGSGQPLVRETKECDWSPKDNACGECFYETNGICECYYDNGYQDKPVPDKVCRYYNSVSGGIDIEQLKK